MADKAQVWSWGGGPAGDASLGILLLDDSLRVQWIRSSRGQSAWDEKSVKTTFGVGSGEVWDPTVPMEGREWRVRYHKEQSVSTRRSQTSVSMTIWTSSIKIPFYERVFIFVG